MGQVEERYVTSSKSWAAAFLAVVVAGGLTATAIPSQAASDEYRSPAASAPVILATGLDNPRAVEFQSDGSILIGEAGDGPATPWQESRVAATAGAEAPSEVASLLERCSELKRQLIESACSPRFSGQLGQVLDENAAGRPASEADAINVVDHFILQQPLADGRTVAEVFAAEHPGLTDDDRQVLQGWRQVVAGVFEIREQAGTRSPPSGSVTIRAIASGPTPGLRSWRRCGRAAS
jgi:hypothetical protein